MSETKRLGPQQRYDTADMAGVVGGVWATNNNPYPVEVTVRRVAEKVVFDATLRNGTNEGDYWVPQHAEQDAMRGKGFRDGQKVRVTIEPLE